MHPVEDQLHRLVDGELQAATARDVEAHLEGCAECRALVARLERLRRAVAQMPREVDPPPRVEAAVRERIARATPHPLVAGRPAPPVARWAIAAAVVIAIGGGVMAQRHRPVENPGSAGGAPRSASMPQPVSLVNATGDGDDARVLGLLRDELERRRPHLSPRTVRAVEENLRTIDVAIAAIRRELAADPANVELSTMLAQTQRQRSEYLRTALDLTSGL